MDIIKRIKPLKATYLSVTLKHKLGIIISLASLMTVMVPHIAGASALPEPAHALVFSVGDHVVYLDSLDLQLTKLYEKQTMQRELNRQLVLGQRLREYLEEQGSPLAAYATTLIQLNNWKKIVALSNAESSFCRHYPQDKANCWGVGGNNIWYMGANLEEGIITMNNFLNTYPDHSKVKYAQMTFQQMNGLYKQPAAQHWVDNNATVYKDLLTLETNL